ncbi:MAG: DUF6174 domain-containing protein [Chloroflexota bacterium]
MRGACAAVALAAMTLALAACGPAGTPTPTPTPAAPVEALCISTEAYALDPITVAVGRDPLPTAFDAINTGGCDFSRPVSALRYELLDADGHVAQTARIELGGPVSNTGIPLPVTLRVPTVDRGLEPGRYVRRVTVLATDGGEGVIAGFDPVLVLDAQEGPQAALLRAQARWERAGLRDYDYGIAWHCFCIFGGSPMTVHVRDGQVAGVEVANPLAPPVHLDAPTHTMDGLFGLLAEAYAQDAARVDVTYDEALGYPTSVYIDRSETTIDEELGWSISELTAR